MLQFLSREITSVTELLNVTLELTTYGTLVTDLLLATGQKQCILLWFTD